MMINIKIILDDNKYFEVTANERIKITYLSLNGNYPKETKGILGSPANLGFFGRDGKTMDPVILCVVLIL